LRKGRIRTTLSLTSGGFTVRTFPAGNGRVQTLAYSADCRFLVVDIRERLTRHPCLVSPVHPCRELVCWDWCAGAVHRRFRLRDSLYGPGGAITREEDHGDWSADSPALDVAFRVSPWLIATAWEWTNKEDGVCVYDADSQQTIDLQTPYKTHVLRLALSPDGGRLAVATVNDMDGSALFEVWDLGAPPTAEDPASPVQESGLSPWAMMSQARLQAEPEAWANPFEVLAVLAFDGRLVAAAGSEQTKVLVWDADVLPPLAEGGEGVDGEPDERDRPPEPPGYDVGFVPRCLAFTRSTPCLAVGGVGLVAHDPATNRWTPFDRSGPAVNAVGFTADGRRILTGTEAGTVELWDVAATRRIKGFDWRQGPITAVALAPDGNTAAAGTDAGRVIVWDLDD
jgi:WD40 repeat protein